MLKSGKDFSRVLLDIGNGYAFGCIESRQINRSLLDGPRFDIGLPNVAYQDLFSKQCDRDLQLIVEVDGEHAVVGSLKAGAAFTPKAPDEAGKLTAVSLALQWLDLAPGATLWVPTSEHAACRSL